MSGAPDASASTGATRASSLLGTGGGLVMITTAGPALVCADGVCGPDDAVAPAAAGTQVSTVE